MLLKSFKNIAGLSILLLFMLSIAWYGVKKPVFQWDSIAYTACALNYEAKDKTQLHHQTYSIVKSSVSPEKYLWLTSGNDYRETVAKNPDAFYSQLKLYHVKPLYVSLIFTLHKIGFNPFLSTLWISILSSILICLVVFVWMNRHYDLLQSSIITALSLSAGLLWSLCSESTPDALSALLLISGIFLIFETRNKLAGYSLLVLSIASRQDNLIFVLILLISQAYIFNDKDRIKNSLAIIYGIIAIGLYLSISMIAKPYGWWTLFHHSFYGLKPDLNNFSEPFSFQLYSAKIIQGLSQFLKPGNALAMLFTFMLFLFNGKNLKNPLLRFSALIWLTIILRFMMYPILWERHFAVYYILLLILFFIQFSRYRADILKS